MGHLGDAGGVRHILTASHTTCTKCGVESCSCEAIGGGRIRCLGASIALIEMAAVMREVLARYELVPDDPKPERPRSRSVSTRPAKGPRLTLRSRKPEPSLAGS